MKKLRSERNDTHVEIESCVRCTLEQNSRGKGKDLFVQMASRVHQKLENDIRHSCLVVINENSSGLF